MYNSTDDHDTGSDRTYRRTGDETATEDILMAVADATDQSPLDMRPLAQVIDADAVNSILDEHENVQSTVSLSFEYCGKQVYVTPTEVQVEDVI